MAGVAPTFQQTDSGLIALNQALDEQIQNMRNADISAEQLIQEIGISFQATASTTWQTKVHEWRENYNSVAREVQMLTDHLQIAANAINNAHEDATSMAVGLGTSPEGDAVFGVLTNG